MASQYTAIDTLDQDDTDISLTIDSNTIIHDNSKMVDPSVVQKLTRIPTGTMSGTSSNSNSPIMNSSPRLITTTTIPNPTSSINSSSAIIPIPVSSKPSDPTATPSSQSTNVSKSDRSYSLPLPISLNSTNNIPLRQPNPPRTNAKIYEIDYYARYFDVDTTDVIDRIKWSLYPNSSFFTSLHIKQDFYGPFWVPTTLIFTLFVTSSLAHSIASYIASQPFVYDFTRLSAAVTTVYTYTSTPPMAIYGIARYYGRSCSLINLSIIYGYSISLWIPVTVLCIIPFDLVRWILVATTFLITGLFLGRNVHMELTELTTNNPTIIPPKVIKGTLLAGALSHAIFSVLLKLLFFSYTLE